MRWKEQLSVDISDDVTMPQFEICKVVPAKCQETFHIGEIYYTVAPQKRRKGFMNAAKEMSRGKYIGREKGREQFIFQRAFFPLQKKRGLEIPRLIPRAFSSPFERIQLERCPSPLFSDFGGSYVNLRRPLSGLKSIKGMPSWSEHAPNSQQRTD